MARTRTECTDPADPIDSAPPLRLRIPASLAIVVLGASTTIAMSFAACETSPIPPPPADAGQLDKRSDAGPDGSLADGEDPVADADSTSGDAPILVDAFVPPDTPHG
jgi:hypothetical protein